ncbi:hypothetical protein [Legionella sp. W05-934-2]|uniref:hypothetical protein n=1 Tax=Legionella sp. W05-934-2 TaxID=1198649 RepID=UPI003462B03B
MNMRTLLFSTIFALLITPLAAGADNNCFGLIHFSVQSFTGQSNYTYVNANYKNSGEGSNYSDRVPFGHASSVAVPCGEYDIAATPVAGNIPNNLIPTGPIGSQSAVGKCVLKDGPQRLDRNGTSVSITFPDDFDC